MNEHYTPKKATGILDLIIKLGLMAESRMENATDSEEYAFLFGNINMAAALASALHHAEKNNGTTAPISLDYEDALNAYKEAKQEAEEIEEAEECPFKQMDLEELFPLLFEALKAISKKKTTPKKSSTKKPSSKKE